MHYKNIDFSILKDDRCVVLREYLFYFITVRNSTYKIHHYSKYVIKANKK